MNDKRDSCPDCGKDLRTTSSGFYMIDGVIQNACTTCIRLRQKKMKLWCILGLLLGLPLGYVLLFLF